MVEEKLVKFNEEDLHPLLLRSENYRLLEDERPTKRFLNLETDKAKYNNVSRLQIMDVTLDKTTNPPTEIKTTRLTTNPRKFLENSNPSLLLFIVNKLGLMDPKKASLTFLSLMEMKNPFNFSNSGKIVLHLMSLHVWKVLWVRPNLLKL